MVRSISNRPRDIVRWLRDITDRLTALENRRSVSVGSWRMMEDSAGQVVLYHRLTGTTVVLAEAPEEEDMP